MHAEPGTDDRRWLAAAARLAMRGRPLAHPNPAVAALVVADGRVIGRGWTAPGGRPHAEARALAQAGVGARGATLYVTLEPCAHASPRGPACADLAVAAGLARVVVGVADPDPRTAGRGIARMRAAGIAVAPMNDPAGDPASRASLEGYLMQQTAGRPFVTLKLATSIDGCIALASGESRWITGPAARAWAHALRARSDAILVGGGTLRADAPRLDVRLPGLAARSPQPMVLTRAAAPDGWRRIADPAAIAGLDAHHLLIEGGASAAAAFLAADLVDRLALIRAPIAIGGGRAALGDIGLAALGDAHGRWHPGFPRRLGADTLEQFDRIR